MEPGGTVEPQSDALALATASSPRTVREAVPIFLRHASPFVLLVALVLAATIRWRLAEWSAWDLAAVAVLLVFWPFQEWLIHVYILHFRPITLWGRNIDFRVPRKHREHHRQPWNYEILFIPLHSYLYSLPLLVLLWFAVMPSTPLAWTAIVVHLALALHYEWVHFLIHTRVRPRWRYYQRLWRNHRLHHFKNEHYWYGVTRLEGDWVFGTAPPAERVPLSRTARNLHESGAAAIG